jgi:hypothetical protein
MTLEVAANVKTKNEKPLRNYGHQKDNTVNLAKKTNHCLIA